jgi:hypothetical protein
MGKAEGWNSGCYMVAKLRGYNGGTKGKNGEKDSRKGREGRNGAEL